MNYKGGIVVSYWYNGRSLCDLETLETEDTMKDYAVVILDLPPLDGNEPVEEELKESKLCGFFFKLCGIFEASLSANVQLKKEYLYMYIYR